MTKHMTLAAALVAAAALGTQPILAADAIDDADMGLSKTSVFETPTPEVPRYPNAPAGTVDTIPVSFPDAPPQIPHSVVGLLPITTKANACQQCHDVPHRIGQPSNKYQPTPMPKSHYTDLRNAPDKMDKKLDGSRYVCSQCHAPQADTAPLVENNFTSTLE